MPLGQKASVGPRRATFSIHNVQFLFALVITVLAASTILCVPEVKWERNDNGHDSYRAILCPFLTAPSSGTGSRAISSIGEKIVATAFQSSYNDMVQLCDMHHRDYILCLMQMHSLGQDNNTIYSHKWPWWYRTLIRDIASTDSEVHGFWHILQYVNPNIQQCITEKAGTKAWRELHCLTIDDKEFKAKKRGMKSITKFNCASLQTNRVHDSDRLVFVRDPLVRFLSGFLDKCASKKVYWQGHCEPNSLYSIQGNASPVDDFRLDPQKLFEVYVDTFPLRWNLHFIPQSLYCDGLYRHIRNYAFVGSMDGDMYKDVRQLRNKYPALAKDINIVFNTTLETTLNTGVETKAADKTKAYYTPYTVRRVLEYYSIDYVMLNKPIPAWAEEMLLQDPLLRLH